MVRVVGLGLIQNEHGVWCVRRKPDATYKECQMMTPDFIATITLYPPNRGGRERPTVGEWFGCPCKFDPKDFSAWDCRIITNGEKFSPGETKELGIVFLTPEAGRLFQVVGNFYLWEGRIIAEAQPIIRSN
jgi:hypothetical protein